MGRQAYMLRMALGRSAFELPVPSVQDTGPERQDDSEQPSGQRGGPREERGRSEQSDSTDRLGHYVQLYDERGHPYNPRTRQAARDMRRAQNDVLAAVGVCVRTSPLKSRSQSQDEIDPEVYDLVEWEGVAGGLVGTGAAIAEDSCNWWIATIAKNILTFDINWPLKTTFANVIRGSFRSQTLPSFFTAGLPVYILTLITNDGMQWAGLASELFDDFLLHSQQLSRKSRNLLMKCRPLLYAFVYMFMEVTFTPLLVHAILQQLHLIPTRPLFPPLRSFIPFSSNSIIQPIPTPRIFTSGSLIEWLKAVSLSPFFLLHLNRQLTVYLHDTINSVLQASILLPDNPDPYSVELLKDRRIFHSPPRRHELADRFISFLGWGRPRPANVHLPPRFPLPPVQPQAPPQPPPTAAPNGIAAPNIPVSEELLSASHAAAPPSTPAPAPPAPLQIPSPTTNPQTDAAVPTDTQPQATRTTSPSSAPPRRATSTPLSHLPRSRTDPPTPPGEPTWGAPPSPVSSTTPEDPPNPDDATIRISSGNIQSGTVNLEIALPDEQLAAIAAAAAAYGEGEQVFMGGPVDPSYTRR
ncbi:hypothetical protein BDY21DRAFT_423417, partial [Lineolata rhizophorae]